MQKQANFTSRIQSLPEKWKFSLFPFSIHIVTELEQGAKNTALLRAGTLSRVRVRKPAAQGASGSTETLLTTAHASKLGQSWGKKMPGISLHFWALDISGSESSDAWGKHLDLRKQNQHCEDAEVGAPKGLLHSRSERNVTALSSQDLSRRNFLQCPEVRIPANIKMPLLSGCTSPACSSPACPHRWRGAPRCSTWDHPARCCVGNRDLSATWPICEPINDILLKQRSRKEISVLLPGDTDGKGFRRRLVIEQMQQLPPSNVSSSVSGLGRKPHYGCKTNWNFNFSSAPVSISFSVLMASREGSWINREDWLSLSILQAPHQVNAVQLLGCVPPWAVHGELPCLPAPSSLLKQAHKLVPASW